MGRAPCCDKASVKKGPWSPEEDAKLKSYIEQNGTGGNWIALPQKIGLKRCGKSCRLRWLNYLRPNIKHGGFSEEEDDLICNLFITIGSRWSVIAAQLPGRTDNDIKNYWNTKLKKKFIGKQQQQLQQRRHREQQAILDGEIMMATARDRSLFAVTSTAEAMNPHLYWPPSDQLPAIPISTTTTAATPSVDSAVIHEQFLGISNCVDFDLERFDDDDDDVVILNGSCNTATNTTTTGSSSAESNINFNWEDSNINTTSEHDFELPYYPSAVLSNNNNNVRYEAVHQQQQDCSFEEYFWMQ